MSTVIRFVTGSAAPLAAGLLVLGACGSSALGGCSSSKSGGSTPSGQIGPGGGSVTEPDGSGVTIPAGALGSNVDITVQADPGAPAPSSQWVVVGTPYLLGPEGQQFSKPVTVTLAIDPSLLPTGQTVQNVVLVTSPATGTPDYTPVTTTPVDATHVSAQTTHFSYWVPVIIGDCNDLALVPVTAPFTCEAALPTPVGGSIADGTYAQTSVLGAGSPCMQNGPSTITVSVSGATWEIALEDPNPDASQQVGYATAIATLSGDNLSLAYSCVSSAGFVPDSGIQTFQYSATATGFELVTSDSALSFTLQGSDAGTGPSDGGSAEGSFDGGGADAGDASFVCVQPANPAPVVTQTAVCGPPAPFTGGTITDGTYYVTSAVNYREGDASCTPGDPTQATFIVSGGMVSYVTGQHSTDAGVGTSWYVGPYSTSGSSFIFGAPCADGGVPIATTLAYTATPTTLTMGLTVSEGVDVGTLTKQ
jgi:hypothetical protein